MKPMLTRVLNAAAVLFGLVAGAVRPSFAVQSSTCAGWDNPACSVTTAWECTLIGVCPSPQLGGWFPCCWENSITREFDYYE